VGQLGAMGLAAGMVLSGIWTDLLCAVSAGLALTASKGVDGFGSVTGKIEGLLTDRDVYMGRDYVLPL
jgi:hypothetical protein